MKTRTLSIAPFIAFAAIQFCAAPRAQALGREVGNGGDICEDRIKVIRDDIAAWINKGGADSISLPQGFALARYKTSMLRALASATVSCTDQNIVIQGAQKTCKNFSDLKGHQQILCDSRLFQQTPEADQYVLVHHEYAGLIGLESNGADGSQYKTSNQISEYLENQTVKKLAVKSPAFSSPYTGGEIFRERTFQGPCQSLDREGIVNSQVAALHDVILKKIEQSGLQVSNIQYDARIVRRRDASRVTTLVPYRPGLIYDVSISMNMITKAGTPIELAIGSFDEHGNGLGKSGVSFDFWQEQTSGTKYDAEGNPVSSPTYQCNVDDWTDMIDVINAKYKTEILHFDVKSILR